MYFDFITTFLLLIFTWALESSYKHYIRNFMKNTIEMNDFSIIVKGMPHHSIYKKNEHDNEESLRGILIAHFEKIIKF